MKQKRHIITTADGSPTIHFPEWNESYHSKHGAIQEAYHVFIKHGFEASQNMNISILEMGFGTGLNTFITLLEAEKKQISVNYCAIEAYPIKADEIVQLDYSKYLTNKKNNVLFQHIHKLPWENPQKVTDHFTLTKRKLYFSEVDYNNKFHVIYFDAFGPRVQPELWTETIFKKMYNALKNNGILTTYSCKGSVKRAMISAGFSVKKFPGPPGKREMLCAFKND